ncbi:carboxymuconolactone decarboxylase family protein [Roseomonas sp. BN140053]|uniref:carboxymuconolactone decarboxylase family protein n=1 Tax=Roseomonas sp. BN140053 TaxID=3391898 RepID=UPI0039E7B243
MSGGPEIPSVEEVRARLDALRANRGFVLEHHGAMAAGMPDLHAAYNAMYAALTLADRHLSPFEKEFCWLAILLATREAIGTHHLDLFRRHGGTEAQAEIAFRAVGYAGAAAGFGFVGHHWSGFFPGIAARDAYLRGLRALCGGDAAVPWDTVLLALGAAQAALGCEEGVAAHVVAAYEAGVPEDKLAEALSLVIWPTGVNKFVDACRVWHGLMVAGEVVPSPRYRVWAETPGLGPFGTAG